MAIEKIAEMFAELGFKVDTKGLVAFEKHLSKLKEDFTGIKSATIRYTDETVKSDKKIASSNRAKTNSLISDKKRLDKARSLDAIVRRMSPLQYEYEQLKKHQDTLNREMNEGTSDAKRYEASLARIQSRMAQLNSMRGVNGNLPFKEQRGAVGRPSRSGIGISGGSGMFGAFGAIAAGIGTNRLQVSTEQTQAKMGMVLSDEEAAKQIKFASDNARALGTNAVAAAAGYADLMVQATRMEIPMADTQNLFMGVTEASVAMGLSMDQQKGIYKAFSDMLAKGTVNAEELDLLAPFHSDMIGLAA